MHRTVRTVRAIDFRDLLAETTQLTDSEKRLARPHVAYSSNFAGCCQECCQNDLTPAIADSIFGHKLLTLLVGAQGLEPWTR